MNVKSRDQSNTGNKTKNESK